MAPGSILSFLREASSSGEVKGWMGVDSQFILYISRRMPRVLEQRMRDRTIDIYNLQQVREESSRGER